MIRSAAGKVMWLGRATVFLVGLAVVLALTVGTVSKATAHKGSAGLFHLGHSNAASALSSLVGTVSGGMLQVTNNSTATTAKGVGVTNKSAVSPAVMATNAGGGPALGLKVGGGKAPMTVSGGAAQVANLDADKVDGLHANHISRGATNGGDTFTKITGSSLGQVLNSTDIAAPRDGALLVSWSSYKRCFGPDIAEVKLFVDNVGDNSFFVVPSCEANGQLGTESFQKLVKVNAGSHNLQIRASDFTGAPNNLELDDSRLDVLFVPFDANGATTFGSSSALKAASDDEENGSRGGPGK